MAAAARRMQDFILSHLLENISLADLARAAGYSPWHAQRIFRELTGQPPFEYIRRLRLTKAALALRDGRPRVIDVALEFMFDSHEGFTRSFAKEFGVTPAKYRKHPEPVKLFLPYPVQPCRKKDETEAIMNEKTTQAIFVQVMERPARKILLRRGVKAAEYFAYCEEVGCDVWGILSSVKEALYEPVGLWLPARMRPAGTSEYVQGVELPFDWSGTVPAGYELVDFAPATVMVFQGEPYDDERFMDAIDATEKKIDLFNPEVYGYAWAPDAAPRFQLEPQGWRGYIEGRPVRKVR
jgi:AraC-like DNA-binding protein